MAHTGDGKTIEQRVSDLEARLEAALALTADLSKRVETIETETGIS